MSQIQGEEEKTLVDGAWYAHRGRERIDEKGAKDKIPQVFQDVLQTEYLL